MEKVVVDPETECWNFTGTRTGRGKHKYGYIGTGSRVDGTRASRPVHIVSYELHVGLVPKGFELDHLCKNTFCCNPKHLEAVTHHENVLRGGVGSWNRVKTHCSRGHPFAPPNGYVDEKGRRRCRACGSHYSKLSQAKRKGGE